MASPPFVESETASFPLFQSSSVWTPRLAFAKKDIPSSSSFTVRLGMSIFVMIDDDHTLIATK